MADKEGSALAPGSRQGSPMSDERKELVTKLSGAGDEELFTRKDVAALFKSSESTVSRWVAMGVFPAATVAVGRVRRWSAADLRRFIGKPVNLGGAQ